MKKTVLFGALALTASALADGDVIAGQMKSGIQSKKNEHSMPMTNMVTLESANPMSENGWYIFADALYWHADVGNTDWAYVNTNTALPPGTVTPFSTYHIDFKWDWGFKIGVGVNMDHGQWDSDLYYTWFRTSRDNSFSTSLTQFASGAHDVILNRFIRAKYHQKLSFNMIDWELGRDHFVSKHLALHPHIGLKGGWIDQKIRGLYIYSPPGTLTPTGAQRLRIMNDFWGIGAAGGVNTSWILGNVDTHYFSLKGDLGGALLWGHFTSGYYADAITLLVPAGAPNIIDAQQLNGLNRNLAVPMLQTGLAFGWDTEFNDDRCHFGLKVAYEFQYWFRQNQIVAFSNVANIFRLSDDLALQGLTIDFRFDF